MTPTGTIKLYPPLEEKINILSHGFGALLSLVGLAFLVVQASLQGTVWHIVSVSVFGVSMFVLYLASTLYHGSTDPVLRGRLKIFDHASIFLLIAGTYTPFALVTLHGTPGWIIFGTSWGVAAIGITLKLFFTGRFTKLSTTMYVLAGWIVIFAIKPLLANLPVDGFFWLLVGGLSYSIGAVLYSIKAIPFNHAIFHILALVGSICHFLSVYFYVLPH
jgi:hemolysin III